MNNLIIPAERSKTKLRATINGPSGSGKTLSALLVAYGITGDWSKIVLIDTESGSGHFYAPVALPDGTKKPHKVNGTEIGSYFVSPLPPPFTLDRHTERINAAAESGAEVVIIDSLSHAWAGEGGVLNKHSIEVAKSKDKNSFRAWDKATPIHEALLFAIRNSPVHIICTMRTKTEWVVEPDEHGKQVPRKVGTAPIQRKETEYEFDIVFDINAEHYVTASKDRTGMLDDLGEIPTPELGRTLAEWLNSGTDHRETFWLALSDVKQAALTHLAQGKGADLSGIRALYDENEPRAKAGGWHPFLKDECTKASNEILNSVPAANKGADNEID